MVVYCAKPNVHLRVQFELLVKTLFHSIYRTDSKNNNMQDNHTNNLVSNQEILCTVSNYNNKVITHDGTTQN